MRADRPDLDVVVDDVDQSAAPAPPRSSRVPATSVAIATLALIVTGAAVALALSSRWQVDGLERDLVEARRELADAERRQRDAQIEIRAQVQAEGERTRAAARQRENEARDAVAADGFVLRDPIVSLAAGTRMCRASDLEVLNPSNIAFLLLANRSGRPCGLLDHPEVQVLDRGGRWRTLLAHRSPGSSYSDGPEWTGMFDPDRAAVFSLVSQSPLPSAGTCPTGDIPREDFEAMRLLLLPQGEPLVIPEARISVGPCRPRLLLWAYDHQGI